MTSNSWLMLIVTCGEEREGRKEEGRREKEGEEKERDTNKTLIKKAIFIKN